MRGDGHRGDGHPMGGVSWPTFQQMMQTAPTSPRARPGPEGARLAVVFHGKIASELHRSFQLSALPSPGILGGSYCALRDMLLEPAAAYFDGIDIFGHAWSPEAQPLIEALYRPTAVQFEEDMMGRFDLACRSASIGGPGMFFPMSCGRTMSHMLGMHRAIQLKSRHEHAHGFQYRAVLVSRWDVLWQSSDVAPWLGRLVASGPLDCIWLPDMCGEENRVGSTLRTESAYKASVCGVRVHDAHKIKTMVSTAAQSCGRSNRGCDWDQRRSSRGLFLLDWWFVSSSELADCFGRIWNDFENLTVAIKTEIVTEKKRLAATGPSPLAGIWLFGHLYWGLHIFTKMRAPVDWAPLSIGIHFNLVRMATSQPHECIPTAAQFKYGATGAASRAKLLNPPPTFELESGQPASASRDHPHQPNFTEAALLFGTSGSPLARACRRPGLSIDRSFRCPGTSAACQGTEATDVHSTALTAGRFIETTKNMNQVVKGCAPYGYGRGSLGSAACAEGLRALWVCMRAVRNMSFSNCSSLLVRRKKAKEFLSPQDLSSDSSAPMETVKHQKRHRENTLDTPIHSS